MLRMCAKSAVGDLEECEDRAVQIWVAVLYPGCFRAWSDCVLGSITKTSAVVCVLLKG